MKVNVRILILAVSGLLAAPVAAFAGDKIVVVQHGGHVLHHGGHHGAPCAPACCEPCPPPQKYCVPESGIKKTTKYKYECKCVDFCLPKCAHGGCFSWFKKSCDPCCEQVACEPCADCEKPRTRKVLIKKPYVVEECEVTCKVVEGCPTAPCHGHGTVISAPAKSAPAVELAPPPKEKK